MNKKVLMTWAVVSAVWVLFMLSMSFQDLKYGLEYRFLHGRVEAEYQARLAAYEQAVREEEDGIRKMLQAAKRYDELEFLALASRNARYRPDGSQTSEENPEAEMTMLERAYGRATLRKYREQDAGTEQNLLDGVHTRLIAPEMREPRLTMVLFNMFALPLAVLLLFWASAQGYRRIVKYRL